MGSAEAPLAGSVLPTVGSVQLLVGIAGSVELLVGIASSVELLVGNAGSVELSPSVDHQLGQLRRRIMTSDLRITLRRRGGEI